MLSLEDGLVIAASLNPFMVENDICINSYRVNDKKKCEIQRPLVSRGIILHGM